MAPEQPRRASGRIIVSAFVAPSNLAIATFRSPRKRAHSSAMTTSLRATTTSGNIVNRERIIISHPRVPRRPLTYAWNRTKIAPRDANRPEITASMLARCDALITISPTISSTKIRQVYARAPIKVPRRYSCRRNSAQLLFAHTREYAAMPFIDPIPSTLASLAQPNRSVGADLFGDRSRKRGREFA